MSMSYVIFFHFNAHGRALVFIVTFPGHCLFFLLYMKLFFFCLFLSIKALAILMENNVAGGILKALLAAKFLLSYL